ncbi:TPA: hypothetical protein VB881_001940 [Streptococcus suis]|uniref:hypothetical protein n=1 Tax=Streptococcus suis TaxID=1307 RepID=UPI00155825B9|nr:hypothetical protein [Streptococcus suis]MBY4956361.1 hypothetical protein [Streptococcus suis]MBY5017465.1 hypothetical protein [Streptococcus suis]MDG4508518.1 hypothetical protein [Streptococcus suis]NQK46142.1 hypothetical protein [Streptococcus suis]NRG98809.1 hypothetical protein [Streptococcus suis]
MKNDILTMEELFAISGGNSCAIIDAGCLIVEGGKWIVRQIPKSTRPVKCQYVGMAAYSCG